MVVDANDDIYMTGKFIGNVDFDPNAGVNAIYQSRNAVFIIKLNNNGSLLWAKSIVKYSVPITISGAELYSNDMALDSNGNLYIVGFFRGIADFNPGVEVYDLTSVEYNRDAFILKLDNTGEFVWAKSFGSPYSEEINSIVIDGEDNVYTTGVFGESTDFNTDEGIFMLTPTDLRDIFIHKLNSDGSFMFANQIGGTRSEIPSSIDISSNSEIIMTGIFNFTVDFNFGEDGFELSSNGYDDVFVTKLNPTTLSIPENTLNENKIKLFPNPFVNKISIISHEIIRQISIYDLNGKLLKNVNPKDMASIDLNFNEKWKDGIYIIEIETDSYKTYKKLIKN